MRIDRNLFLAAILLLSTAAHTDWIAYTGTYTRGGSKGIYAARFDSATGKLVSIGLVAETPNPTFLAVHPNQRFLYAVNEINNYEGQTAGSVSAYSIDAATGQLTLLNRVSSKGTGPCHVALDKTGKWLFVANYAGGSAAAFPVQTDGKLGEASAFFQHSGSSVNPQRHAGPHAHMTALSPDGRFLLVPDLGLDQVLTYRLDAAKGGLAPSEPPFTKTTPGSGPRHLRFGPDGKFVYVLGEMTSTVTAFSYNADQGTMKELQTLSTLPEGYTARNSTAETFVHPKTKVLYVSNRGHDSIAIFQIDPKKGTLTAGDRVPTQGKTPRYFAIDPSGDYLLAANQDSGNVVVFRIDQKTGGLTPTGSVLEIPFSVCVVFAQAK